MTAPNGVLFGSHAHNPERFLAAWLAPLRRSGSAFRIGDPLPFTLITKIGGLDDPTIECAEPLVSVHTLCDRTLGYQAAEEEADKTHRAMLTLARWCSPITLNSGEQVALDYALVVESPIWVVYEDVSILRQVGRYKFGLCYTNIST